MHSQDDDDDEETFQMLQGLQNNFNEICERLKQVAGEYKDIEIREDQQQPAPFNFQSQMTSV